MTVPASLFILSFRQRDELAALAAGAGWQVVAARRAAGAERRFLSSGATVAVIDARGAVNEGLAVTRALSDTIEANGGALLILVSRGDITMLGDFHDAGATHFLASPSSEAEFLQMLRFAARHAERLAGEWREGVRKRELGWRHEPGSAAVHLAPALADLLGLNEQAGIATLLRCIDRPERGTAIAALRRLSARHPVTAFAHDMIGHGRVVQHLQFDAESGRVEAVVELLGAVPTPDIDLGEASGDGRDAAGARHWINRQLETANDVPLFAMMVALNRFDVVNNAYGRTAGDHLLRAASGRIVEAVEDLLGKQARAARVGGSSFLVTARVDRGRIDLVAERIARELARPFVIGESIAVLGCRIGMAEAMDGDDAASLLRRASEALADARDSDSATMRVAGQDGGDGTVDRLSVELHRAIDRGEIEILFQPQVSVSTGIMLGVEALARWEHGEHGTIGAETLFAAAARADLEIGLSDHIQRLALERAAAWPAMLSGLRLSLNLTAADIARPGFADLFLDRVDASGFPRNRLTLEITESGLIDDLGNAAALLTTLRSAGCRVAIDDFGTGYSSLAYLKALPLDYLKIDKKLAQDITGTTRDRVVVRGVIEMARSLGLTVIAEGVETAEQLDLLAKEGCQIYQGFLCSGAVTGAALEELLAA
ncbi:MAG: diguanylate cyclase [Sphingomonas bacterium]|uniref:putative bifunctional diguanylate cyclase/phosphodiesterase n=1 Tax=Sphingomonas bacterium TaxID=1895847 RepID=UPI0026163436|nr:EAL domain-containing protein [Sphingomonas bacterium]MDB5709087.1 diguanylate cyclase [Sphingomonas bacterium]